MELIIRIPHFFFAYQREDWRQRPLSAEMVEYAVTDAHYLLYIADCLVTEMKAKGSSGNRVTFCSNFTIFQFAK